MTLTAIKERPILFSGEMVRAILDGKKSQTRRVVTCDYDVIGERADGSHWPWREDTERGVHIWYACPYGVPGDRLYVRETFFDHGQIKGVDIEFTKDERIEYRASQWSDEYGRPTEGKWTPSIHMPRWASRLTLELTAVRVERVQDISEADCRAEGIDGLRIEGHDYVAQTANCFRTGYAQLWDSLNKSRGYSWESNPWVWVLEFSQSPPAPKEQV